MGGAAAVRARRRPDGFTLIEMLVAVTLTMLVFAITIPFFRAQARAVGAGAGRLDALQNARYAAGIIDRDLRMAGGVFGQPIIVQAAPMAITFNVDLYARSSTTDPDAAYVDATMDTLTTESMLVSAARNLATSTKSYPTATYTDSNGTRSAAETISFYLVADATSGRSDIYSLYRRVNAKDSTFVTGNLWIPADTGYFFKYYRASATGSVSAIANNVLPLYWNDATRTIDSIGVVEVRSAGWHFSARDNENIFRTVYSKTAIHNLGRLVAAGCGAAPAAPTGVTATVSYSAASATSPVSVTVAWNASTDDGAGANDVQSYTVMRRASGNTTWIPVGSAPARGSAATFTDYALVTGTWVYGVKAMDCGPAWSAAAEQSGTVTIP